MKKLLLTSLLSLCFPAFAQNSSYVEQFKSGDWSLVYGSHSHYNKYGLSYTTAPLKVWQLESSTVDLSLELEASKWDASNRFSSTSMWQAAINPVWSWRFENGIFLQGAIGASYFSKNTFADKEFGSRWNFSDNLAVGYQFTDNTSLAYRISHYSNAGLKNPNPGINMQQLILTHRF